MTLNRWRIIGDSGSRSGELSEAGWSGRFADWAGQGQPLVGAGGWAWGQPGGNAVQSGLAGCKAVCLYQVRRMV
jgi:hypothetical protein